MILNHLHLRLRSRDQAEDFYPRHSGFRRSVEHDDVLFLRDAAGLDLALAPSDPVEPLPEGLHFGFRLESADEVSDLYASLTGVGVRMVEALTREPELIYFRCADLDGYQIEVYWEPEPDAARSPDG